MKDNAARQARELLKTLSTDEKIYQVTSDMIFEKSLPDFSAGRSFTGAAALAWDRFTFKKSCFAKMRTPFR